MKISSCKPLRHPGQRVAEAHNHLRLAFRSSTIVFRVKRTSSIPMQTRALGNASTEIDKLLEMCEGGEGLPHKLTVRYESE